MTDTSPRIAVQRRGHLLLIALDRPAKRNAFDSQMLAELGAAYTELDADPELRCGVLYANGPHFTGGLDLGELLPRMAAGEPLLPAEGIDPWGVGGRHCSKPVVAAVHGKCLTAGIELLLAADIRVAATDATFAQLEVGRGIFPFGGATARFVQAAGWGAAMRWMLTGDEFDAEQARELGVVQQVVPAGTQLEAAIALAERVAAQAPLGVQGTLRNARLALESGPAEAFAALRTEVAALLTSQDARIGFEAFLTRSTPNFVGE